MAETISRRLTLSRRAKELAKRVVPEAVIRRYHRYLRLSYVRSLRPEYDPSKKTILALNHYYDQDLRALALANTEYNLVVVNAPAMFFGANRFFSLDVVQILAPYESEPEINRLMFRGECQRLFETIVERFRLSLVITANDNFFWVREFIAIAREHGVKTVVLDKEGTISPHSYEAEAKRGREFTPFVSDHVFVWSERQKAYWEKRQVPSDRITVLGQPRSDLFFSDVSEDVDQYFPEKQPLVTHFSYMDTAYMPLEYVAKRSATWRCMKRQTNELMAFLSEEFPEYNFVVKCHPQQPDVAEMRDRFERRNLRVIGGAEHGNELVRRSELIIGFQTTALIEAMFLGRRVIYTAWDSHLNELREELLPFERARGIVVAASPEQLGEVARRSLAGDVRDFAFSKGDLAARDEFVNQYFYRPDGQVCRRFFDAIGALIQ